MKKGFIKIFAAVLLIILVVASGCSGGNSGSSSKSASGSKGGSSSSGSKKVTITYWQYTYPSKVTEIKKLVKEFEAKNPNITVVAQDFPYDQYNQKIAAAVNANKGPDIMNLYYGWLPQYVKDGYIQAIPSDFMSNSDIESYYVPMIKASKLDGKYYGLPIAVRSLALFYNKDLFKSAGLDPSKPPQTWDELVTDAKKMTKIKSNGQYSQEGFAWNVTGQGYHTFEEVLLRQWGVQPFSDDNKKVLWNSSPNGLDAFTYWINMTKKEKVGTPNFLSDSKTAFLAGKDGMLISGSFLIGDVKQSAKFNWGVTTLPVKTVGGEQSNFGSYWTNSLAKGLSGDKLKASEKFMKFLISKDVEKDWLNTVGELPASAELSKDPTITQDPVYGPFVKGLSYAHATFFADESKERDAINADVNKILLNNAPIDKTFNQLVQDEQKIRDDYFSKQ